MSSSPYRRKRTTNGLLPETPPSNTTSTSSPSHLDDVFKHLDDAVNGESGGGSGGGTATQYISGERLLYPAATKSSSEYEQEISELRSNMRRLKHLKECIRSREEHIAYVEGQTVALKEELHLVKLQLEGHESFKMENQGLKTAIQDAEVRASSHERMATHLRNEKHNLDTVIEGLRLEVEKQKLENAHLKSNENLQIDELKAEIEMYKQELQPRIEPRKIMHEIGEVQNEWGTQEVKAKAKEEELASLRGLLKEARGAVEKTRTAFEETTGPRITQLTKLREEKQLLVGEIGKLKEQNESLISERFDLKQRFDILRSELNERDTSMQHLRVENANLKASASRLAQKRILSSTAASAAGRGATCHDNVEKLKTELRKAKSQVEASDKTVSRLEQQLVQMKNNGQAEELNNANATISKLRKLLERERREREHFSTARAALLDKLGDEKDDALTRTAWHVQVDGGGPLDNTSNI